MRVARVSDVKERNLRTRPVQPRAVFVGRSQADGQQVISRKWMNVGGYAGHLEFAQNGGVRFVGNIDHPQRVNFLERDEVRSVGVETCAPNPLPWRNAFDTTGLNEDLFFRFDVH